MLTIIIITKGISLFYCILFQLDRVRECRKMGKFVFHLNFKISNKMYS